MKRDHFDFNLQLLNPTAMMALSAVLLAQLTVVISASCEETSLLAARGVRTMHAPKKAVVPHSHEVTAPRSTRLKRRQKDGKTSLTRLKKLLATVGRRQKELAKLTGELEHILSSKKSTDEADRTWEGSTIIINSSTVYGNVIGGNSDWSPIKSEFLGNRKRSLSVGDTQWKHTVFMPIGNTKKSVDVSANGTNIRHRVDTDLFDKGSHRLGEIASSRGGGDGTDLSGDTHEYLEDLDEDSKDESNEVSTTSEND
ncbi:unnamed protein product [Durusdinium trenchii]|uniref:Uncharacterized protein n=2 Tax=Durusdinium trenchii TaxID=1381693 RepID=A0ABP0SRP8_9DINO